MNRDEVLSVIRDKSMVAKATFGTSYGTRMMEILEQELDADNLYVEGDPHKTSFNLGRRDALIYIKQLVRFENEN